MLGLVAAGCGGEIDGQRKLWESQRPAGYSYRFQWDCFCPAELLEEVEIAVRGTQVVSVIRAADGSPLPAGSLERYRTVDGLFDLLEEAEERGADEIEATYDPRYGYPTRVSIDYEEHACVTQRFDSLLRANPHFHALVPDAVSVEGEEGRVELRAVPKPTQRDVESIVERIARRARALLSRLDEDAEPVGALDRLRGQHLELLSQPPELNPGRLSARAEGFSLHAARHLHANDRAGLESLARTWWRRREVRPRRTPCPDGSYQRGAADTARGPVPRPGTHRCYRSGSPTRQLERPSAYPLFFRTSSLRSGAHRRQERREPSSQPSLFLSR